MIAPAAPEPRREDAHRSNLALTADRVRTIHAARTGLTLDRVREIRTAAARRVIGDTFGEVDVEGGDDGLGRDAYFFVFRVPTEQGWGHAAGLASRLMAAIIDDLQAEGDARFPHIRPMSDGSWTLKRSAADV